MQTLAQWVERLSTANVPVLRSTIEALNQLRRNEEALTPRELSQIVLQDPLMALRALRYSQSRVTRRQVTEITTIEHILMMFGLQGFFDSCRELQAIEDVLAPHPMALKGVRGVISRAHHAAHYARAVAGLRFDVEIDEIVISALLHDLAELMLWSVAPTTAMQLEHMVSHTPGLRSVQAQRLALGFTLVDLELVLARSWNLPKLVQLLLDDSHAENPRVLSVTLSVALARHSAHGWYDPALPHDFKEIGNLVHSQADQVLGRIRWAGVHAARDWEKFGVRPALAWLPMLPGTRPEEEADEPRLGDVDEQIVEDVIAQLLKARPQDCNLHSVFAAVTFALTKGLGLRRIWWGELNALSNRAETAHALFLDAGLLQKELHFKADSRHLFAHVMQRQQGVWANRESRPKLLALVSTALAARLSNRAFFALSLHAHGQPHALIYADAGRASRELDEARYALFKRVGLAAGRALERTITPPRNIPAPAN